MNIQHFMIHVLWENYAKMVTSRGYCEEAIKYQLLQIRKKIHLNTFCKTNLKQQNIQWVVCCILPMMNVLEQTF